MLRNSNSLMGYKMGATDGEIGEVKAFFFDDETWAIRFLVIETGGWLNGRKVLISPKALLVPDWKNNILPVNLTKEQIKNSPDIDTEKPVSRQHEILLQEYYPWKSNWAGGGMGTSGMMTQVYEPLEEAIHNEYNKDVKPAIGDAELRSTSEIKGYSIHASDGKIGEVEDFIIDDSCWKLDFLVVDTGNWFPGKKVLISPKWIKEINWAEAAVMADATVEQVKNSPAYDADQPINELYKKTLHDYYGKLVPHEN